jgi:hypothetical protein
MSLRALYQTIIYTVGFYLGASGRIIDDVASKRHRFFPGL